MKAIDLHIITIFAMAKEATERLADSVPKPEINQSRAMGEKLAYDRVLGYLKNQNDTEEKCCVTLRRIFCTYEKGVLICIQYHKQSTTH